MLTVTNAKQILAMIRSRADGDEEAFYSIALPVRSTSPRSKHEHIHPAVAFLDHALRLVPQAGLEPALLSEQDFESSASTNSTTGAQHADNNPAKRRSL